MEVPEPTETEVLADKARQLHNPIEEEKGNFFVGEMIVMKGVYFEIIRITSKKVVMVRHEEIG